MLINKISDCCKSIGLTKDIKVGVAVSGGSDSLALALALKEYGQNIVCFIVDHKLRQISGEHALQTKNILQQFDIESDILIWEHDIINANIEGLARLNRYKILTDKCKEVGAGCLFLGHHADDQVETFLLNLLRGSGIDGLCAMQTVRIENDINLIRPFLDLKKNVLQKFLVEKNVSWLEDETNQDINIKRNKLRLVLHELLPDLNEKRILLAISNLQESKTVLDKHYYLLYKDLVSDDYVVGYDKYVVLLPQERYWVLNKIFIEMLGLKFKTRLSEIKNLDKNIILGIKKSTLLNCFIVLKNGNIFFVKI